MTVIGHTSAKLFPAASSSSHRPVQTGAPHPGRSTPWEASARAWHAAHQARSQGPTLVGQVGKARGKGRSVLSVASSKEIMRQSRGVVSLQNQVKVGEQQTTYCRGQVCDKIGK